MGDPLSTVSAIGGIISLGLTVTGGLADYYSAWKDGDEDVASTSQAVAQLNANLQLLKDSIQSNTVKCYGATERVNASITQCEAGIVRLQKLLEKIKTKEPGLQRPNQNEFMRKLGDQGRRLLYPFRQGTLGKLRDIISELSDNLTPAVHALQINIGVDTLNDLRDLTEDFRTWRLTGENQRILSWLSPLDFQQRQKDILSRRCPDTGSWFLDSEAFRKWRDSPLGSPPGLWCTGKMGTGKSSLTSLVIDHLQSKFPAPQFAIAYVYCDWQDSVAQSTRNLVGSLLQQLVQNERTMPLLIKDAYARHKEGRVPISVDESLGMIGQVTKSFRRTFICIDGLDECGFSASEPGEGRKMRSIENALLNLLGELTTTSTSPSVFVTSRFHGTRSLPKYYTSTEITASTADLRAFIKSELTDASTLYSWTNADLAEHVASDQKLLEATIHRCLERADNMFLLPKLHVALLKDQCNLRKFRIALNSLPYDLGESIRDALQRIQTQSPALKELGLKALLWISRALRPLRVDELQHALAVEPDDEDFEEAAITSVALIVGSCAGLVTLDSGTRLVRLVNCSIRQCLEQMQEANPDAIVARTCCLYLGFPIFDSFKICDQKSMDLLTKRYPLVAYASEYWGIHAKHDESNFAGEVILRLLRNSRATDLSYHCMYNSAFGSVKHCSQGVSGLHLAAFFGLDVVVKTLLDTGASVDVSDSLNRTPLYVAAANGQAETVELLLCAGAKVSGRNGFRYALLRGKDTWWYPPWAQASEWGEALQAAADAGHPRVVDILLAAGANVDTFSGFHKLALDAATFRGHKEIVQSLLNHGARIHRSTIQAAVYYGDPEILRLLVEGLPQGKEYSTATKDRLHDALYAAALADRRRCAQYLIEQGVNVNENTIFFYRNALQAAASQAYIHMMNLLMENGANVNNFDDIIHFEDDQAHRTVFNLWQTMRGSRQRHGSALQSAAYAGHGEAISLLLSHGAELNEYSGYYGTSLQSAACQGHLEIVRGLIKAGSHINTRAGFFGNPLQAAAAGGHTPVVELLLASGAHANAEGGMYGYPLIAAARSGNFAIVKLLVDHGADVNAVGGAIGTALSAAAVGLPTNTLSTATTEHLLVTGPSMTEEWLRMRHDDGMYSNVARCGVFGNILRIAAGGSFGLEQDLLLDDDQIYGTENILKEALTTSPDNADIVEYLLDCGAHPNQSGGHWGVPIIAAAYAGRLRVVKLLVSRGADVHSLHQEKGSWYVRSTTAIQAAADMGHTDVVECLRSEYGATLGYHTPGPRTFFGGS